MFDKLMAAARNIKVFLGRLGSLNFVLGSFVGGKYKEK